MLVDLEIEKDRGNYLDVIPHLSENDVSCEGRYIK